MSHPQKNEIPKQSADLDLERGKAETRLGRFWHVLYRAVIVAVVILVVAFSARFISFVAVVSEAAVPENAKADAIVVLTGGTERIHKALELLEDGRASRLLISGVHPGTSQKQIAASTAVDEKLFDCCVDLDRVALNTMGNAHETADWARRFGFRSLLVVTSAYHIPRAEIELRAAMPDLDLIAYPVFSRNLDLRSWYLSPATIHLLLREYVKYTLAQVRLGTTG